jgi:RNA polymerase sigma-70 factor (ECF subfamily)
LALTIQIRRYVTTPQDDQLLFDAMVLGQDYALEVLLRQYHNYLTVVAGRYLSDGNAVQDVIHDVFTDLWQSGKQIDISCSVKSYLRGAVTNKCLSTIRRQRSAPNTREEIVDQAGDTASPLDLLDMKDLRLAIAKIVAQLPERCREVYLLSRNEGKTHKEIAALLDTSTKTVENHITRALRDLRQGLQRQGWPAKLVLLIFTITVLGDTLIFCNTINRDILL